MSSSDSNCGTEEELAKAMYNGMATTSDGGSEADPSSGTAIDAIEQQEGLYVYECAVPDCDGVRREQFDDARVPDRIWEYCEECGRDTFQQRLVVEENDEEEECPHESVGLKGSETNGNTVCEKYNCTECGAELRINVDFAAEEAQMKVEHGTDD